MPWHLSQSKKGCSGWAVVKDSDGSIVGCHATKAKAMKQLAALNINAKEAEMDGTTTNIVGTGTNIVGSAQTAPLTLTIDAPTVIPEVVREEATEELDVDQHIRPGVPLYRALLESVEMRDDGADGGNVMVGHFAVFDDWTKISSWAEGTFMERISRGAFRQTFKQNAGRIRVLAEHGNDPQIGNKPIGVPQLLEEDDTGARYEVPLFDSVPPLLTDGIRAGAYGSSFRFRVLREQIDNEPKRTAHNPDGLPERTIKEVELYEFGPVTFPAYQNATAGMRSLTDEMLFRAFVVDTDPETLQRLVDFAGLRGYDGSTQVAPSKLDAGAEPHLEKERRAPAPRSNRVDYLQRRVEAWRLTPSRPSASSKLD